jgi:hypothetical protein
LNQAVHTLSLDRLAALKMIGNDVPNILLIYLLIPHDAALAATTAVNTATGTHHHHGSCLAHAVTVGLRYSDFILQPRFLDLGFESLQDFLATVLRAVAALAAEHGIAGMCRLLRFHVITPENRMKPCPESECPWVWLLMNLALVLMECTSYFIPSFGHVANAKFNRHFF